MNKPRWIIFLLVSLFLSATLHAEKTYLDYLNEVKGELAVSEANLTEDVQALGVRYYNARDDSDFLELKTKSVLLWVVRACHNLAQQYTRLPESLELVPTYTTLPDFKQAAKDRANTAAMNALNLSVELSKLEFERSGLVAQLASMKPTAGSRFEELQALSEQRRTIESRIEKILHQEIALHGDIPTAYIEAAVHIAVSVRIRKDLGEIEEAEKASVAFELFLDSASTAYANALVFFGRTRMDSTQFTRGLDAIDGAEVIHANALKEAEPYL